MSGLGGTWRPRVAIVTTSFPRSEDDPAGHFVRAEARRLEREGSEVVVLAPPAGGAFGWPGVAARLRRRPWRMVEAAAWVARSRREVARVDAARVIAHWAVPCGWPIGVAARGRLEVVSHGGDVRLLASRPGRARAWAVRAIVGRAAAWRFVSPGLRDELLVTLDPPLREKVERLSFVEAPPLDLPDVSGAIVDRRRSLAGRRAAVSVGRLVPGKRVDRAIAFFASRADLDVLYVLGDGPERHHLQRLARSSGVDVRFLGTVGRREALAWIGAAHVLIQASEAEGLSTVEREAAALGTPVARVWPGD